jgi:hypothetical protein
MLEPRWRVEPMVGFTLELILVVGSFLSFDDCDFFR